jgi:hypothetical protein
MIGKELDNTGWFWLVVIGGQLSQRKLEGPAILLVGKIGLELLFQNCINMVLWVICFWVKCGGELRLDS